MILSEIVDQTAKKLKSQSANLVTLSNLFLGGFAIISTFHNQLNLSLLLIFIAALADRFDGIIARKFQCESDFGKQLDSMSDIISFGVAPALLLYQAALVHFDVPGILITLFYIACGAYRLARFNITETSHYFIGLPITVAGCFLTLSYLALPYIPGVSFLILTMLFSFLMISPFQIKKM
ncbi:CDP-diacylglycerol--serine O-phosphatidyltransferase [Rossellomorea aquimaris]|uniref:CDP-diacylglycerol--serine O-phosphatidyltransferase n=1 Tax=Rossellomorea aquimaris TaxID=189382 RepID=UPI0007D09E55|nr:CDP-diacylglycerol--serine O-phosphatidyltransferase [Rossellomorea aquimaris]